MVVKFEDRVPGEVGRFLDTLGVNKGNFRCLVDDDCRGIMFYKDKGDFAYCMECRGYINWKNVDEMKDKWLDEEDKDEQ